MKKTNVIKGILRGNISGIFNHSTERPKFNLEKGPWIAGGAARALFEASPHLGDSDIDVFFTCRDQLEIFKRNWIVRTPMPSDSTDIWGTIKNRFGLEEKNYNYGTTFGQDLQVVKVKETEFSETYEVKAHITYKVQLIRKFFKLSAEDLLTTFDFSVCQVVTDLEQVTCTDQFLEDHTDKKLRLANNGTCSVNTVRRLNKYMRYGFEPTLDTIPAVLAEFESMKGHETIWENYDDDL